MGKRNRGTRSNTKVRKIERLIDEPKAHGQRREPDKDKQSAAISIGASLSNTPASPSQAKTEYGHNPAQQRNPIMRVLIAVRVLIRRVFLWCDEHHGAITAIATVAIVALTVVYVIYSMKQWEAMQTQSGIMQRQLNDSEASASARLIVEDFRPKIRMGKPGQGMLVDGTFTITNAGGTIANDIYFTDTLWGSYRPPGAAGDSVSPPKNDGKPGILSESSSGGTTHYPALPAGKSLQYPFSNQIGMWDDVEAGTWFTGHLIDITYKNIFSDKQILYHDCFMYDRTAKQFFRCPEPIVREDRLVPKK